MIKLELRHLVIILISTATRSCSILALLTESERISKLNQDLWMLLLRSSSRAILKIQTWRHCLKTTRKASSLEMTLILISSSDMLIPLVSIRKEPFLLGKSHLRMSCRLKKLKHTRNKRVSLKQLLTFTEIFFHLMVLKCRLIH